MTRQYFVYIMANERPTLYVGSTGDLVKRAYEHKQGFVEGFTKKYGLSKLVYYEIWGNRVEALHRERRLKRWNRNWKLQLVSKANPDFRDLYEDLIPD